MKTEKGIRARHILSPTLPPRRRRDPMLHPTRLVVCPNAITGCPRGDECDMVHTVVEVEMHPITLLRQLRWHNAAPLASTAVNGILSACPFTAQLGIKKLSQDGRCALSPFSRAFYPARASP